MKLKLKDFVALLIILAAVAIIATAKADNGHGHDHGGGDVTQSNDMNNQTAGDIMTGGVTSDNKSFAFSHSLGDVDINEGKNCLGSEAWGTILVSRQTNELNPWCAALFYELNGKHLFAAKMRCDIKDIRSKYTTDTECWDDQDLTPTMDDHDIHSRSAEFEETYGMVQQQEEEIVVVQMAQTSLEGRVQALEQRPAPRPRVAQAAPPEKYSDDQFDAVWAALKGGDENE